jgi:hypothetical protein
VITRNDILDALSMLSGNDSSKTPNPDELNIRAWMDYFADHPHWSGDDLVAAAHEYCRAPRERMVQPADLGLIVKGWHDDRLDRMDPDERVDAYADLGGARYTGPYVPRDHYGQIDKTEWEPAADSCDDEHPPGPPCKDRGCAKPSTFGPYCARHYCLNFSLARMAGLS